MIEGSVSPPWVTSASRVARTEASASTSTPAPANRARSAAWPTMRGEDGLEAVVVAVVEVVGLGGGEQDAVDAPPHQSGQPVGAAEAEGGEDVGQRRFEVGDGGRAGVEGREGVDENDLPVEAGEVIAEEGANDRRFVRLVAARHHARRASRADRGCRRRGGAARR